MCQTKIIKNVKNNFTRDNRELLNGSDSEQYIVGVEYDYQTNKIFKIIQDPERGKIIKSDTLIPFLWVGDLSECNFYGGNKSLQKKKMVEFGIVIEKLQTHGNNRLENGQCYLVKSFKNYTSLVSFFRYGGVDPWNEKYKHLFTILSPVEQFLVQKKKRLFKGIDDYSVCIVLFLTLRQRVLNLKKIE